MASKAKKRNEGMDENRKKNKSNEECDLKKEKSNAIWMIELRSEQIMKPSMIKKKETIPRFDNYRVTNETVND